MKEIITLLLASIKACYLNSITVSHTELVGMNKSQINIKWDRFIWPFFSYRKIKNVH